MINSRLEKLREKVIDGYYTRYRESASINIQKECDCSQLDWVQQVTLLLQTVIDKEQPVIEQDERIVLTRTTLHPINPIPAWIK